ncbi:MAG TPA: hypothetical protein PLK12_12310 [Prolixibacteraceae bacterium]|nr:hypothetical protein [Prolixibacteraceae bacterium]
MRKPEHLFYKGFDITYLDYSNLKTQDEIFQLLDDGSDYIRSKPPKSVLSLINVENMFFNSAIRSHMTDCVKLNTPYIRKSAVFGLGGLITVLYNSFIAMTGRNMKSFKTREEALEYLVTP